MQLATQWMVVSDLGLTAISGDDGVHALVQSLGSAGPLAGVELKLVARNNEVLATKTTGADGRADFDPGLSRGKGGSAPGLLVATLGDDYNFLNLAQNAFDLTDRGVGGRDAPDRARRLPLHRARRLSLGRDGVRDRAAARRQRRRQARAAADARRQAARRRRIQARDPAPTRASADAPSPFRCCRARRPGKWTIYAYADPKGDAIGETQFLLEDYIPERLDFTLHPAKALHRSGRAGRALARREVPLRRAGERARRDRRDPPARRSQGAALAGLPRLCRGPRRRRVHRRQNQFADKVETDAKGHADLSVDLPEGAAARPLEAKLIVDVAEPGGRTVERTLTLPVRAEGRHDRGQEGLRRRRSAPATSRPSRRSRSRPTARASRARAPNGRSTR